MTKSHISVKDTSQTVEEAGKTDWVCSSPPPSLVTTSSKAPGPGWVGSRGEIVASRPCQWWPKIMTVFLVQQDQRLKFDIYLLMASTFNNSNGPSSSGSQGLTFFFDQQHLYINTARSMMVILRLPSVWNARSSAAMMTSDRRHSFKKCQ